jgi:hypothetical protein
MDLQIFNNCFLFNENKEDTSGVNIKSAFCFTALEISFSVFFKLCKILLFDLS